MKEYTLALVGLGASAVAIVGLVVWGRARAASGKSANDPTVPPGSPVPIGPFPDLKVGSLLLVDSAAASLPPPFSQLPQVPGVVDQLLSDPLLVSAQFGVKGQALPLGFSGTIRRDAIVKVLPPVPGTTV